MDQRVYVGICLMNHASVVVLFAILFAIKIDSHQRSTTTRETESRWSSVAHTRGFLHIPVEESDLMIFYRSAYVF